MPRGSQTVNLLQEPTEPEVTRKEPAKPVPISPDQAACLWHGLQRPSSWSVFRTLKGYRRIFPRFEKLDALFIGLILFALIADALR